MDEQVGLPPVSSLWGRCSLSSEVLSHTPLSPGPSYAYHSIATPGAGSRWVLALRSAHTLLVHEVALLPPPYASCLTGRAVELCAWVRALSPTKHTWARKASTLGGATCKRVKRMACLLVFWIKMCQYDKITSFSKLFCVVFGMIRVSRGKHTLCVFVCVPGAWRKSHAAYKSVGMCTQLKAMCKLDTVSQIISSYKAVSAAVLYNHVVIDEISKLKPCCLFDGRRCHTDKNMFWDLFTVF